MASPGMRAVGRTMQRLYPGPRAVIAAHPAADSGREVSHQVITHVWLTLALESLRTMQSNARTLPVSYVESLQESQ